MNNNYNDPCRGRFIRVLVSTLAVSIFLYRLAEAQTPPALPVLAQSADAIVTQARRALSQTPIDMVCEERTTISHYFNGRLISQKLEEAIVSTPRFVQGVLDVKSSYRELLRVDGKPVSTAAGNGSTANITEGVKSLGTTAGLVFTSRNSFEFKILGSEALDGSTEELLVLQFERKAGSEAPWWVPDSGQFWLDPDSKRLVRVEIHDQDLAPTLPIAAKRTFVEDFGAFTVDGQERWMVKTLIDDYYPDKSIPNFSRSHRELSNCRKFSVSTTITPK